MFIGREIFNFIGAVTRWAYGTAWRTLFKKERYSFKEYLRGSNTSEDWFDKTAHEFNNKVIGLVVFVALIALIKNYNWLINSLYNI